VPVRIRPSAPHKHLNPAETVGFFVCSLREQSSDRREGRDRRVHARRAITPHRGETMSQTIRLLSWNVNGIRAVHKKGFLDWLQKESPDILCLQETKASPDQLPRELLDAEGFRCYWHSAKKKGYSGVGVYSKMEPACMSTGFGVPEFDDEGRVIRLDFAEFSLFNVYFPNGKAGSERLKFKMDFYDAFLDHVEEVRKAQPALVFTGDVNTAHREIDLARPKENEKVSGFLPMEREWIGKAVSRGYVDTFRRLHPDLVQYSWWDMKSRARERNVGWRIDYVFVTEALFPAVRDAFILTDVLGSDHCPVGIQLELGQGASAKPQKKTAAKVKKSVGNRKS
jgi:exodeoxyribonuclease III